MGSAPSRVLSTPGCEQSPSFATHPSASLTNTLWNRVDPIVGLLISVAILGIVKDTAVAIFHRVMDAMEPEVIEAIERTAASVSGVEAVPSVRARWHGHRVYAELTIVVNEDLSTRESHTIVEKVRRDIFHTVPKVGSILVHTDPCGHGGDDHHRAAAHHEPAIYAR